MSVPTKKPPYSTLKKPLIFFALKSTGIDVQNDQIRELAYIKYEPNQVEEPVMVLSAFDQIESKEHLTASRKRNQNTFEEHALSLFTIFEGCDLSGPRVHFDTLMLQYAFSRVGLVFATKDVKLVDPIAIHYNTSGQNDIQRIASIYGIDNCHPCEASRRVLSAITKKHGIPFEVDSLHELGFRVDTFYYQYLKGYHTRLNNYSFQLMRSKLTTTVKSAIESAKGDASVFYQFLEREGIHINYLDHQAEFVRDSVQISIPYFLLQNQGIRIEPSKVV
ncbi:MAG: hypothetical protein IM613_12995 [Cytophagales bacterium]|nr:hypothetical protein [Cytophagales bacterium]